MEYYFTLEKRLPETVFLFWRTTPTLMVGKYQNVLEEINKPYADEHGIHLVRRMSGGGTIYTDMGGWQFTFIQHQGGRGDRIWPVHRPGDRRAEGDGGERFLQRAQRPDHRRQEVLRQRQYRLGDCIVHHGSLLFDTDIEQMVASTTVDSYQDHLQEHQVRPGSRDQHL